MDQTTVADLRQKLIATFNQVSEHLYYKGEGPYFMATLEDDGEFRFYFYEVNDVESFLADPGKTPAVFSEPDFLFSATDDLAPNKIKFSERSFLIFMMRLVPDSPVCRLAIKKLHEQNSEILGSIALINHYGKIVSANTVLDSPAYLS